MEQVLKYKFWILSGLVLPLALTGFFLANAAMQAATEERIKQLEGIQAPNPNQPNDTFTAVARKQADDLAQANVAQLKRLDKIQRSWMTWPPEIERGLERKPDTGEIIYRADIKSDFRVRYREEYETQMRELWLKLNPVIPSGLPYTSRNLVFCEPTVIPMHPFPSGRVPSSQAIWDAQEDFWILSMLAEAINRTNAVAQFNVSDSAIREISYLELFGGTGESTVLAGAAAGTTGAEEYTPEYMGRGEASGPQGASLSVPFADGQAGFDPQEEYGSQAGGAAQGAEASYMGVESGLFGGAAMGAKPLRYIGFDESNPGPYRRRGFYISLLILERKIPDFVTNLANLDPPILAGRWGFANNPYDEDHLLRAATRPGMGGMRGLAGPYEYEMGGAATSRGPRRPTRPTLSTNPYGSEYDPTGAGRTILNPRDPLAMMTPKMRLEVDALRPALLGKDLVQLDLTGVVTIFTPEVPPDASTPEEEAAELPPTAVPTAPSAEPPPAAPTEPTAPPATESPLPTPAATEPSTPTPAATEPPAATPQPPATDPAAAPPNETPSPPPASPEPSQ